MSLRLAKCVCAKHLFEQAIHLQSCCKTLRPAQDLSNITLFTYFESVVLCGSVVFLIDSICFLQSFGRRPV